MKAEVTVELEFELNGEANNTAVGVALTNAILESMPGVVEINEDAALCINSSSVSNVTIEKE